MNFDFSDDQRLLQEAVRKMLAATCTSKAVRSVLDGQASHADAVWRNLLDMGAAAAAIPEEYGGAGLGYLELCLVAEEVGRHLAPVPLSSSFYLAAEALRRAGSAVQRERWLPAIARGAVIATAALGQRERYRPAAALVFDGATLSGSSPAVPDGAVADIAMLRVGADLVLVELDNPSVRRVPLSGLDPTRPMAELHFARAPAQKLDGGTADGAAIAERVLDGAAVLLAFEQVGGATRALELARDYALERKAFGRQIGSFQALKHKMADMFTRNELARVHAYYGAWALSSDAPELPAAAAAARVAATTAFNFAAEESIEIHGGIGFTWEMDCHLYYRRARHLGLLIGSEHAWRARLADQLVQRVKEAA